MDRGKRIWYPLEEMIANLRFMLNAITPNINALLEACARLSRVNLQIAELLPGAPDQPRPPSREVSAPKPSQEAAAPLRCPTKKRAPVVVPPLCPMP